MNPEDRMRELGTRDNATPSEAEWLEFRGRGRRSVRNRRIAGVVGGVGLVLALVAGYYVVTAPEPPTGQNVGPATKAPEESPTPDDEPTLGHTGDLPVQVWWVQEEELRLTHQFTDDPTPEDALERLLLGPTGPDMEAGETTAFPSDAELLDYQLTDGIAHVTFGGSFPDETDVQEELVYAQTVYTLTQFPEITKVAIGWESGESGGVAQLPVTRKRYEELLPPIVVETPYPGQDIQGPFELTGIANVFEATVSWRLLDSEGKIVKEGFTTATCGTGCWGTFEDVVKYDVLSGAGTLQIFESSAEDGSPLHMVEVPLNFH